MAGMGKWVSSRIAVTKHPAINGFCVKKSIASDGLIRVGLRPGSFFGIFLVGKRSLLNYFDPLGW